MVTRKKKRKHPSYGMVQFNRCSGMPNLFGTTVRPEHFISLTVRRCEVEHSYGEETFFGGDKLIEVYLSASQFAELLTTMNVGYGVPCTLRKFNGASIEPPPSVDSEAKQTMDSFQEELDSHVEQIQALDAKITTMLAQKTVKKSELQELKTTVGHFHNFAASNAKFILERFRENTERMVQHAKAEIDNFLVSTIQKTGLEALKNTKIKSLDIEGGLGDDNDKRTI